MQKKRKLFISELRFEHHKQNSSIVSLLHFASNNDITPPVHLQLRCSLCGINCSLWSNRTDVNYLCYSNDNKTKVIFSITISGRKIASTNLKKWLFVNGLFLTNNAKCNSNCLKGNTVNIDMTNIFYISHVSVIYAIFIYVKYDYHGVEWHWF